MGNRLRRRFDWALLVGALGVASMLGCDNTVNIRVLQISLREIYPVGASYTLPEGSEAGAATCEVNDRSFDLKLLLLGNTRERTLEQVQDGDLLQDCTFRVGPGQSDADTCYLNDMAVTFEKATAERLSAPCQADADCGEGWTCNRVDGVCERPLTLNVTDVEYVDLADVSSGDRKPRAIALIIDNSGSNAGMNSDGEYTETPTDAPKARLTAAVSLLRALEPGDRVGVFALSGTGESGVRFVSEQFGEEAGLAGGGFYSGSEGHAVVEDSIDWLDGHEQGGTPVWDAIEIAAQALHDMDGAADYAPSIVLITDGYRSQDLADPVAAREEYGPLATSDDALAALRDAPAPVFIAHLENSLAVRQVLGRDARLEEVACASGGAYYRMERPDDLKTPFQVFLSHLTRGYYRLQIGYEALSGRSFPPGEDYAITGSAKVNLGGGMNPVRFQLSRGTLQGRIFDSRVFVTKPSN